MVIYLLSEGKFNIMKITVVTDVLGEANNGTTLAALNLINSLKSKGHEVKVVCPDRLKIGEEGYYVVPQFDFGIFNSYVKKNGVVVAKANRETIEEACKDADIVHSILPFSIGIATAKYCNEKHIPITSGFHAQAENITSHIFSMNSKFANRYVYHILWKRYYKYVDAIHFPTQFICDIATVNGIKGPKPYVISNGVQLSLFNLDKKVKRPPYLKDKFVILMSGRLSKEKNQKMLFKAVQKSKYKDSIQVVLAGDGPRKKYLFEYGVKHLANAPIIRSFPHEELNEALHYADLYVHTSTIEIEAISCLEALACGLVPVIANSSRSATSKFSLRPESSYNYLSAKDLAKKIDWWIEHPEERKKASAEYAEYAKQFDFNKCMDRMEQMLIEVKKNYTGEKPWLNKKKRK